VSALKVVPESLGLKFSVQIDLCMAVAEAFFEVANCGNIIPGHLSCEAFEYSVMELTFLKLEKFVLGVGNLWAELPMSINSSDFVLNHSSVTIELLLNVCE